MQSYENKQKEQGVCKRIVLDFLGYLAYKIKTDSLTVEETESLARAFAENLNLTGTTEDFARYYGQSRENVKMVINRKMLAKPKRRVFYSFDAFRKVVPKRWLEGNKLDKGKG